MIDDRVKINMNTFETNFYFQRSKFNPSKWSANLTPFETLFATPENLSAGETEDRRFFEGCSVSRPLSRDFFSILSEIDSMLSRASEDPLDESPL